MPIGCSPYSNNLNTTFLFKYDLFLFNTTFLSLSAPYLPLFCHQAALWFHPFPPFVFSTISAQIDSFKKVHATMPSRRVLRARLPPIRRRGLQTLANARRIAERRCAALEQQAWDFGGALDYAWVVRRLCRAPSSQPFEAVVAVKKKSVAQTASDPTVVVSDGLLQCGKCKSRKIDQVEVQTRSGDEAATLFCLCTACGNRWKMWGDGTEQKGILLKLKFKLLHFQSILFINCNFLKFKLLHFQFILFIDCNFLKFKLLHFQSILFIDWIS